MHLMHWLCVGSWLQQDAGVAWLAGCHQGIDVCRCSASQCMHARVTVPGHTRCPNYRLQSLMLQLADCSRLQRQLAAAQQQKAALQAASAEVLVRVQQVAAATEAPAQVRTAVPGSITSMGACLAVARQ